MSCAFRPFSAFGSRMFHAGCLLGKTGVFPDSSSLESEGNRTRAVRPYSWICSGAVVGHSTEVKHSVLLPGSKAPHFNYVGDSTLGKGANLGAGTKLSNLRNDGGEVYLRFEGQRVGSGLRKFGAVLGEHSQLGCNSVTNPGTVLGPNSTVWPNVTVTGIHPAKSTHR